MNPTERAARNAELQSILRTHPKLRLEVLAAISRLFREHEVDLPAEVLAEVTLGVEGARLQGEQPPGPPHPLPSPKRLAVESDVAEDGHLIAFEGAAF